MIIFRFFVFVFLVGNACEALAAQWLKDVKIQKISGYQYSEKHFAWFSEKAPDCDKSSVTFVDGSSGGRSMLTLLLSAQMAQVNLDISVDGCDLIEVYVKAPGSS